MKKNRFSTCASNYIDCLRKEGRYSTAHVYKNAVRSFSQFCGTQSIEFTKINRENLKRYSKPDGLPFKAKYDIYVYAYVALYL